MTPDIIERAGCALFGSKAALADSLGVSARTVRRWCVGTEDIPPSVRDDLLRLVDQRQRELRDLSLELMDRR